MGSKNEYNQICWECEKVTYKYKCIWCRTGGRKAPKGCKFNEQGFLIECPEFKKDNFDYGKKKDILMKKYNLKYYQYQEINKIAKENELCFADAFSVWSNERIKSKKYELFELTEKAYNYAHKKFYTKPELKEKYGTFENYLTAIQNKQEIIYHVKKGKKTGITNKQKQVKQDKKKAQELGITLNQLRQKKTYFKKSKKAQEKYVTLENFLNKRTMKNEQKQAKQTHSKEI